MEDKNKFVDRIEAIRNDKENKRELKREKRESKRQIRELREDERDKAILAYRREQSRLRAEKERRKDEIKEQKITERESRRKSRLSNRQRKGLGGYITAIATLSVCSIILATALTLVLVFPINKNDEIDSLYERSFYNVTDMVDNIDANLSKAIVTSDKGALQKYLVDTAINSELCENSIQELPLQDESKFYTTKLINQIGDYSKYLNNKIIDGQDLTTSDLQTLISLYNANLQLKNSLQEISSGLDENYSFSSLVSDKDGNIVLDNFNELQNLSAEYPELIYDGPFSDGKDDREVKNIKGEEIDYEGAKERFINIFGEYGLSDIQDDGESQGNIPCINIEAEVEGDVLYAEFSKVGGNLIMFSYSGSCLDINFTRDEVENKAVDFLDSLGISNMESVWINLSNNVYTINFAFADNGVIAYPDLIKVRVCAETGMIIGFEATSYYTNHTNRIIGSPVISESVAKQKLSANIEIETTRLCIVPIGNESEKLCFEFSGRYNDTLYFVYIDASTGRQVEMFKVIDSLDGEMLI